VVGTARLHDDDAQLRHAAGRRVAFRHAWADGRDYQNRVTFEEIVRPERIVYRHGGGEDVEPVQFRQTVIFEDIAAAPGSPGAAISRRPRNATA